MSRAGVVATLTSVGALAGTKLAWELARWTNAHVTAPVPFDLVPGAIVLVAAGAALALAAKRPRMMLFGGLGTIAVAITLGTARAYWWPSLRGAIEVFSRTEAFAVSTIAGILAALVWAVVFTVHQARRADVEDSASSPPAI